MPAVSLELEILMCSCCIAIHCFFIFIHCCTILYSSIVKHCCAVICFILFVES